MKQEDIINFVNTYITDHGLTASASTSIAVTSSTFLNESLLEEMKDTEIKENLASLLDETIGEYRIRTTTSERPTKVRDIDIRPVLKKKFCSLPPFCK